MFYCSPKAAVSPLILTVLLTSSAALGLVLWDYIENPLNLDEFQAKISGKCIQLDKNADPTHSPLAHSPIGWYQLDTFHPVSCTTQGVPGQPAALIRLAPWSDDPFASLENALYGKGFLKLPPNQKNPALWGGSGYFINHD